MQQGHDKVVAVLLENDSRGKVHLPALHIVAKKDDVKAAALLLQNEHNIDDSNKVNLHFETHVYILTSHHDVNIMLSCCRLQNGGLVNETTKVCI